MSERGKTLGAKALQLIEAGERIAVTPPTSRIYQHTVLCQTCLPHRPTSARTWEQEQGHVSLSIEAGRVKRGSRWVDKELPHGEKPRLLLIHLNTEAVLNGSREVDVARSMTAFVQSLGIDPNGVQIRDFKEQLARLVVATVRFAVGDERRTVQGQMQIVEAFDVSWPKNKNGRIRWPDALRLSDAYFRSIQHHAVPLDPRAVAALKGSSLCLDAYCWLAQRLHRIPPGREQKISWAALKEQFGAGYDRERDFRAKFNTVLLKVGTVYDGMQVDVEEDGEEAGLTLRRSPPPVPKRLIRGGLDP